MKKTFQLNSDENIRFDKIRNEWIVELLKNDYLDGVERWIEIGSFASKTRAETLLKKSR